MVKKADRALKLWDGDTLFGTYSIGLGWNPEGDKQVEGDGRTPEGNYYVCVRNSQSSFYLSLGVSYPNKEDAKEALDAGTINKSTYDQIVEAIENGSQPPWNTAMGGAVMIHGLGGNRDWTAGCVAVDNDVMDILWKHCKVGTPIIIEP
ncbi:MAG: L,D-transpeptidase family protein [Eubacteriales bacterium]|nr:L,D-transpeptidase family protein [Eubacteriales bacterium]